MNGIGPSDQTDRDCTDKENEYRIITPGWQAKWHTF